MKKTNFFLTILLIVATWTLNSCCTLSRVCGMAEDAVPLAIESSVPNANVYIKGKYVGQTPCSYFGTRANVKKIKVTKDGYKDLTLKTKRKNKGSIYWNFVPMYTFIWGYVVDIANGNGKKYIQDSYYFNLIEK